MADTGLLNNRRSMTVAAIVLFALVFVLRLTFSDPGDGLLFLAIVPIAMLALEYRVVGGVIGALVAAILLGAWVVTMDVELGAVGTVTRLLSFLVVGVGVGLATRSRTERDARLRALQEAEQRHAAALQIHDEVVQSLTIAKMALEMNEQGKAAEALADALDSARAVVTQGVVPKEGALRSPEA